MTPSPFHITKPLSNPISQFAAYLESLSERMTSILHSIVKNLGVIKKSKTRGEWGLNTNLVDIYVDFSTFLT